MRAALIALALVAVITSAQARINAVVLGQPVSMPVIGLAAAAVVLTLTVAVLVLLRTLVRDCRARTVPRRTT
jgi:hypothetical protein